VAECLPRKHKALSSNPSTEKKRSGKKKKQNPKLNIGKKSKETILFWAKWTVRCLIIFLKLQ
jgi:hypothetical protein